MWGHIRANKAGPLHNLRKFKITLGKHKKGNWRNKQINQVLK